MLFKNILVPYDTSAYARAALETAVAMAKDEPETRVHVLSVVNNNINPWASGADSSKEYAGVPTFLMDSDDYKDVVAEALERDCQQLAASVKDLVSALGERAITHAAFNTSITTGILSYAIEHECDLVIMGRRGMGALRSMLGSVSFSILQNADIPVMVVK